MFFTGEQLTASELRAAGGAVIVAPDGGPLDHAHRLALRIAAMSPTAVRVGKAVLDRIEWMDLRSGYEFEQAATVRMAGFADSKEALAAFREKRDPRYLPLHRSNPLYPA